MIRVAITGGIGSGKSTVCDILAGCGVPVFLSDAEARRITDTDPVVMGRITELLGPESYTPQGMNRAYVSSRVFADGELLARLNAIIHPAVGEAFERWAEEQRRAGVAYVVIESAILFESGFDRYADAIVTVSAPRELRIERAAARDNAGREQIERRMDNQMSDAERELRSDYIIENMDMEGLRIQTEALHDIFSEQGRRKRGLRIEVGEQSVDLSAPVVMTIVNVTPDSFYAEGRTFDDDAITARIRTAVAEGASIIDIGGYSSRPGAGEVSPEEEYGRVARGVRAVRECSAEMVISVDTFRSDVAERIIDTFGPCIINDISGGELDSRIMSVAAQRDVPYIAMHMRGTPATMQSMTSYEDFPEDIFGFFRSKVRQLRSLGVKKIIIDPGFGFAKTTEQNYALLSVMRRFKREFPRIPLLAGISRKSMIYKILDTMPAQSLNGTTALHWECLRQGADILRVHDTREAAEVIALYETFKRNKA